MKLEKFMKEGATHTVPEFNTNKLKHLALKYKSDMDDAKSSLINGIGGLVHDNVSVGDSDTLTWIKDNIESMMGRYTNDDTIKELMDMVDDMFKSPHHKYPLQGK